MWSLSLALGLYGREKELVGMVDGLRKLGHRASCQLLKVLVCLLRTLPHVVIDSPVDNPFSTIYLMQTTPLSPSIHVLSEHAKTTM